MAYVPSLGGTPGSTTSNTFVGYHRVSPNRATPELAIAALPSRTTLGYSKRKYKSITRNGRVGSKFVPTDYMLTSYNYEFKPGAGVFRNLSGSFYAYSSLPTAGPTGGNGMMVGNPLDCFNPWVSHSHNLPTKFLAVNAKFAVETRAIVKARQGFIDMSENLAGLQQTANMMVDIVTSVAKMLAALRRGDFNAAQKAVKDSLAGSRSRKPSKRTKGPTIVITRSAQKRAADGYLRWIYGIAPLLGDIRTAMDQAIDYVEKLTGPEPVSFTTTDRMKIPRITSSGFGNVVSANYQAECTTKCRLTYRLDEGQTNILRAIARKYSADNPLYFLWVATPWSFVMDWFIPVASFLQALSGVYGFTYEHGYVSQTIHAKMHEEGYPTSSVTSYRVRGTNASYRAEGLFFRRDRIFHPTAKLYFANPFKLNRLFAVVALAISNTKQTTSKRRAPRRAR